MLSIVIPTKNEEKYLPKLLKSIGKQTFCDYEIIVADNASHDRTREIAANFNCKIVQGGLPAAGRNHGAEAATGDIILFLDADTELPDVDFLKNGLAEFEKKDLAMGVPIATTKGNYLDHLFFRWWNYFVASSQFVKPLAGGWCIFVKRNLHQQLGGFDEKLMLGEDSDYAQRGVKLGKFRFMSNAKVQVSPRRLKKEGYLKVLAQDVGLGLYLLTHGKMDEKNIFGYEFDIYDEGKKGK
ncbi:MAG: glycosyltransferase [Candidatus Pacebacteria bacterium]|jgi:glycosyltransferase involved in cell wall biosynthesis|nr:glycosyltransferase [Candidatus Paceibacterota bacterium]